MIIAHFDPTACQSLAAEIVNLLSTGAFQISLVAAGKIVGRCHMTVWRWIQAGKPKGYHVADRLFVSRREVMRLALKLKSQEG